MPRKLSTDTNGTGDSLTMDKSARKTERSHEENQERAYIAASRRADRSIEARVQSAHMASKIHKKRTGKGFKITEEIVMKEEMYEEEDDVLPRSYLLLSANMETSSPEMNDRLDAYLTNKVAMSQMLARTNEEWRSNRINKLFAESFPNVASTAQQLSQNITHDMPQPPPPPQKMHQDIQLNLQQGIPPPSPLYSNTTEPSYSPSACSPPILPSSPFHMGSGMNAMASPPDHHHHQIPAHLSFPPRPTPAKRKSRAIVSTVGRGRRNSSKPMASGVSKTTKQSAARQPSGAEKTMSPPTPVEGVFPTVSAFTTELPAEARMFLGAMGPDAVLAETLAAQPTFPAFFDDMIDLRDNVDHMLDHPDHWTTQKDSEIKEDMAHHFAGESFDFQPSTTSYVDGINDTMSSKCLLPGTDDPMWQDFVHDWTMED